MSGLFIAFEGGEGAGKSTQLASLADWLRARGHPVVVTREPGGTDLGRHIRSLLLDSQAPITSRAELLLYSADRAHHVETVVRPALEAGKVVLSDRYIDSTLAYQGGGRGLRIEDLRTVSAFATGGLLPDLTVVLDVDASVGLRRAADRSMPDRVEAAAPDFHEAVRAAFLALAAAEPQRYVVIDVSAGIEAVGRAVRGAVAARLRDDMS